MESVGQTTTATNGAHAPPTAQLARQRDEALAALAAERQRNAGLLRQHDEMAREIFALRRLHAGHSAQVLFAEVFDQLKRERVTIRQMERSWFWRARLVWLRLRG